MIFDLGIGYGTAYMVGGERGVLFDSKYKDGINKLKFK